MKQSLLLAIPAFIPAFILLVTVGCAGQPGPNAEPQTPAEVVVFAAASLTEALNAVGQRYQTERPDVALLFNFAGSQQLAAQMGQGARADIFVSADGRQMDAAAAEGQIDTASVQAFACNRLVIITSRSAISDVQALARPGLKLVIGAESVPAGVYTREFLQAASRDPMFTPDFESEVMKNVVSYEQSVRAVLGKVRLGEADAGFVYASDAVAPRTGGGAAASVADVQVIRLPDALNPVAVYPLGLTPQGQANPEARRFVDFLFSAASREILTGLGFSFECLSAAP